MLFETLLSERDREKEEVKQRGVRWKIEKKDINTYIIISQVNELFGGYGQNKIVFIFLDWIIF